LVIVAVTRTVLIAAAPNETPYSHPVGDKAAVDTASAHVTSRMADLNVRDAVVLITAVNVENVKATPDV